MARTIAVMASEFVPEKRGFRIHGHSTTIRLERVFWTVLGEITERLNLTMPQLIERIYDGCLIANDKNIASCLRVICMKYMNTYT
jgi:predicted DNA-binding ribbon-helix-helix protein